jgi:dTDP-4-amino-4,6-dideoxygalactose transaminase
MNIYLSPPQLSKETQNYITEVLNNGWIAPNGPENKKLEALLASYHELDSEQAISCSSGTAALHLIYKSIPIEKNDVVFCPSLTFVATVNPIIQEGGIPWFVDSENKTGGMSVDLLEKAIQDCLKKGMNPKAVVLVHLLGYSANSFRIAEICKKYKLFLVEDAAASLGTKVNGEQISGKYADASAFSFNGNKIITTSGGGLILSKHKKMIEKSRYYRDQAKSDSPGYWHEKQGFNYALSNISAAIGVGEMKEIDQKCKKKASINTYYQKYLSAIKEITFFPYDENSEPNYWLTAVFLPHEKRNEVHHNLKEAGIESRYLWNPLHKMPFLNSYPKTLNGVSEKWAETGLCLPSGIGLTESEIEQICKKGFSSFPI